MWRIAIIIGAVWSTAIAAYQLVEDRAVDSIATLGLGLTAMVVWMGLLLLIARC